MDTVTKFYVMKRDGLFVTDVMTDVVTSDINRARQFKSLRSLIAHMPFWINARIVLVTRITTPGVGKSTRITRDAKTWCEIAGYVLRAADANGVMYLADPKSGKFTHDIAEAAASQLESDLLQSLFQLQSPITGLRGYTLSIEPFAEKLPEPVIEDVLTYLD